jgi:hypothetical protein
MQLQRLLALPPFPPSSIVAFDPERLEHPFQWDSRLLSDGADVRLVPIEKAEEGLIGGHEDGADEVDVPAAVAELDRRLAQTEDGPRQHLLAHAGPVALDQVAPRVVAPRHTLEGTNASRRRNRVIPYVWVLLLPT